MSVAKSFISTLVGIAIEQGYIGSTSDSITKYVSQLENSAYDDVKIKDVLQMSRANGMKIIVIQTLMLCAQLASLPGGSLINSQLV